MASTYKQRLVDLIVNNILAQDESVIDLLVKDMLTYGHQAYANRSYHELYSLASDVMHLDVSELPDPPMRRDQQLTYPQDCV